MPVGVSTLPSAPDWLIVGGGVIGMMLARALARQGATVTLVERGRCGMESSWAGGGIVSPLYPWRYVPAVTRLASEAQRTYPQLAQELLEETGIDIELRQTGLLMLRVEDGQDALQWARGNDQPLVTVSRGEAEALQPGLGPGEGDALWMQSISNLRNPRLLRALRASLDLDGRVRVLEQLPVEALLREGRRVGGVRTAHGPMPAGGVVVCAGAWAGELLKQAGYRLPVVPVRGQMLLFQPRPGLLQRVVLRDGRYLVPRADGHVLVGSTLEYEGFDARVTREGYASLHAAALRLLPALGEVPVKMHWSGLRPGAPDGVPFMGRLPAHENLFISAGHFRNGLVLAPAATRFMLRLLMGEMPDAEARDYAPRSSSSVPMPSFFIR